MVMVSPSILVLPNYSALCCGQMIGYDSFRAVPSIFSCNKINGQFIQVFFPLPWPTTRGRHIFFRRRIFVTTKRCFSFSVSKVAQFQREKLINSDLCPQWAWAHNWNTTINNFIMQSYFETSVMGCMENGSNLYMYVHVCKRSFHKELKFSRHHRIFLDNFWSRSWWNEVFVWQHRIINPVKF